jgi:hypothetical protein
MSDVKGVMPWSVVMDMAVKSDGSLGIDIRHREWQRFQKTSDI